MRGRKSGWGEAVTMAGIGSPVRDGARQNGNGTQSTLSLLTVDAGAPLHVGGGGGRTDTEEDEEDEEDLADGDDGEGEGGEDLAEGLEAAEEAEYAQGAHDAGDAGGLVGEDEGDERHADDEHVEPAPHVGDEGDEPRREGDDDELAGEDYGEEEVGAVEGDAEAGEGAVGVDQICAILRLEDRAEEALCAAASRACEDNVHY